ncbi:putative flavin-nucleotide-binding protein [Crepidotus variabilis]|uniref:Flavin-nucleotide-binding protein n=1 Tax=Crepidotus variabilis TaxID=179855 RepID=A0A9P6EAB5_9AGAR|nr:putative flavin-nucleotide-binding protein [Crepidotus variabilis]
MAEDSQYTKTFKSTVNRLKDRADYDHETVQTFVNGAPVLHVSFVPKRTDDDPFPTILPMIGGFGSYTAPGSTESSSSALYLHGHISARLFKTSSASEKTPWEEDGLPGLPVCVCATHMDGLVLALTPFKHDVNYRSTVVHGYATLVTDLAEKNFALRLIPENILPNRWENSRVPPTDAEIKVTGILKIDVVDASAKVRAYAVENDKADLVDVDVTGRVWTGTVRAYVRYETPIPGKENAVKDIPKYIDRWIEERNRKGEEYAREITSQLHS